MHTVQTQVKDVPFLAPRPSFPSFPPGCALFEFFLPVRLPHGEKGKGWLPLPRLETPPPQERATKVQRSALRHCLRRSGCHTEGKALKHETVLRHGVPVPSIHRGAQPSLYLHGPVPGRPRRVPPRPCPTSMAADVFPGLPPAPAPEWPTVALERRCPATSRPHRPVGVLSRPVQRRPHYSWTMPDSASLERGSGQQRPPSTEPGPRPQAPDGVGFLPFPLGTPAGTLTHSNGPTCCVPKGCLQERAALRTTSPRIELCPWASE